MRRQPQAAKIRTVIIIAAALIGGSTACSSDDGSSAAPPSADDASTTTTESGGASGSGDEDANAADGAGTGTLTMGDDTVYTFETSTCDTSENSDSFVVTDGYDITGKTSDGAFRVSFNRSGFDESSIGEISTLEGEFDENGQNAELVYQDVTDTMALTVDGANVSGTLSMSPIGSNNPHGEETEATVEINC